MYLRQKMVKFSTFRPRVSFCSKRTRIVHNAYALHNRKHFCGGVVGREAVAGLGDRLCGRVGFIFHFLRNGVPTRLAGSAGKLGFTLTFVYARALKKVTNIELFPTNPATPIFPFPINRLPSVYRVFWAFISICRRPNSAFSLARKDDKSLKSDRKQPISGPSAASLPSTVSAFLRCL